MDQLKHYLPVPAATYFDDPTIGPGLALINDINGTAYAGIESAVNNPRLSDSAAREEAAVPVRGALAALRNHPVRMIDDLRQKLASGERVLRAQYPAPDAAANLLLDHARARVQDDYAAMGPDVRDEFAADAFARGDAESLRALYFMPATRRSMIPARVMVPESLRDRLGAAIDLGSAIEYVVNPTQAGYLANLRTVLPVLAQAQADAVDYWQRALDRTPDAYRALLDQAARFANIENERRARVVRAA